MHEALREIAELFFGDDGNSVMLLDEYNDSEEYNQGRARGHVDAYWILQGVADAAEEVASGAVSEAE